MVVVPAPTPVTTPEALIVATDVLVLLQEPPAVASVKVMVLLTQTVLAPLIAAGVDGTVITVTVSVSEAVPQVPETV
jgi:hypothetical protein